MCIRDSRNAAAGDGHGAVELEHHHSEQAPRSPRQRQQPHSLSYRHANFEPQQREPGSGLGLRRITTSRSKSSVPIQSGRSSHRRASGYHLNYHRRHVTNGHQQLGSGLGLRRSKAIWSRSTIITLRGRRTSQSGIVYHRHSVPLGQQELGTGVE